MGNSNNAFIYLNEDRYNSLYVEKTDQDITNDSSRKDDEQNDYCFNEPKVFSFKLNSFNSYLYLVSLDDGVRVYSVDPFKEIVHHDTKVFGTIDICGLVSGTRKMVLVSGGKKPKYENNIVWLYNCTTRKIEWNVTMRSKIQAVYLTDSKFAVALRYQICIWESQCGEPNVEKVLDYIHTSVENMRIGAVTTLFYSNRQILVYPNANVGYITILDLSTVDDCPSPTTPTTNILQAHRGKLKYIALSRDGNYIATAAERDKYIKVWDSTNLTLMNEIKVHFDPIDVYCLCFNWSLDLDYLSCSTNTGMVYVFKIIHPRITRPSSAIIRNNYSSFAWHVFNFKVSSPNECICTFTENHYIFAVCRNGLYYKYDFNSHGVYQKVELKMILDVNQ